MRLRSAFPALEDFPPAYEPLARAYGDIYLREEPALIAAIKRGGPRT